MGRRRFCKLPVLILRYSVLGLARLIPQVCARDNDLAELAVRNTSIELFNTRFVFLLPLTMADGKEKGQQDQTFTSADRIRQLNDVDKVRKNRGE